MDRRAFLTRAGRLGGAAVLGSTLLNACDSGTARNGTNVLVVYMDDMRYDGLQFMPNTRRLFDHHFTQCRANGGFCTDTRVGLHTGTYAHNHPWHWYFTLVRGHFDAAATWGPWMQAAGYETGYIGEFITTIDWKLGIADGWDFWRVYDDKGFQEYGYSIDDGVRSDTPSERNLDYLVTQFEAFIGSAAEPWFANVHPKHPHTIRSTGKLEPNPEHLSDWSWLHWPVPLDEDVSNKPSWVQALAPPTLNDRFDIQEAVRQQARVLTGVDEAIAVMFTALDKAGTLEDTVILFSSDQGVHYGEHRWGYQTRLLAEKATAYEPTVRCPLLATGPGFSKGTTDVPTTQSDITATVVGIGSASPSHALDGIDLRSIVADPESYADRTVLLGWDNAFDFGTEAYNAVVTGPNHSTLPSRKYVDLYDAVETECYDLDTDLGELINWSGDEGRVTEEAALAAELAALLPPPPPASPHRRAGTSAAANGLHANALT